jgi:hypothetical protein
MVWNNWVYRHIVKNYEIFIFCSGNYSFQKWVI